MKSINEHVHEYMLMFTIMSYNLIYTYVDSTAIDIGTSEYSCRICLGDGPRSDFIAPCACSGGSKWVHRYTCIHTYRQTDSNQCVF